jgi:hypothetical protein
MLTVHGEIEQSQDVEDNDAMQMMYVIESSEKLICYAWGSMSN